MGVLADDADPMVSVMKVDKAPPETYADVGKEQPSFLFTPFPRGCDERASEKKKRGKKRGKKNSLKKRGKKNPRLSGGLEPQVQEIKEAVELPLTHPELYEDVGIKPPKGVILYGEPGTGKTLLAKAVVSPFELLFPTFFRRSFFSR